MTTETDKMKVWTITVFEQSSAYDDFDTESGQGHADDVEPFEVDREIVAGKVAALEAKLADLGVGQWDGGSTAYDPDGSRMAADAAGTITTRFARVDAESFDAEAFVDGYVECALWADCMPADRCDACGELLTYDDTRETDWRHADPTHDTGHAAVRDDNAESGGCEDLELREGVRERMAVDCMDFIAAEFADLTLYCEEMGPWHGTDSRGYCEDAAEARAGHDFWLTRSGHGAGFWDRGLGELGDRLSAAAKVYGTPDDHTPFDCGDGTADA